ncbi:hypothetical protein [Roseomonas indoligenes]|uniref:Uncharacterized protein n=1 Tax=Roseomonas indoligenes TaxID=2820811 RepID=A0A940MRH8_9PROT|nr:hypothetical protein [Pararoseomonas indoligenes]MBP0492139.1 hypothetical protein [Pararoseomonas indoligenes]
MGTAAQPDPRLPLTQTTPFLPASSPPCPPDFWDRVAREVARLMMERQGVDLLRSPVAMAAGVSP